MAAAEKSHVLDTLRADGTIKEVLAGFRAKGGLERVGRKDAGESLASFRIYRWANYALSLPPDEPMLPLFWQGFFSLFFARYMSPSLSLFVGCCQMCNACSQHSNLKCD